MLQALVFDFDGLIADTETPEFESWREEFLAHGTTLEIDEWIKCVGAGPGAWDVFDHLESLVGPVDRDAVGERRRSRYQAMTRDLKVMPGVAELVEEAWAAEVPCAIASSSEWHWVAGYLERLGLSGRFAAVVTRDMVASPKPAPDLYVEACARLGAEQRRCVALEDSVNGVASALAAGLYCVAVPNGVTARFDLSGAHWQIESLTEISLDDARRLVANGPSQARSSAG